MKYALIGCGRISLNHIKAAKNNNLEIIAICDINPQKMVSLLSKTDLASDLRIKKYVDYKEMIKIEHPDLVSIATESGKHAEIAIFCIQNKCHVIIEKPIAMSIP